MDITTVKADLKRIARMKADIEVFKAAINNCEKRLVYLQDTDKYEAQSSLEELRESLRQTTLQSVDLEKKYMTHILKVKPLYRTLLIDHYINGTVRWKVAAKLGYSDSWTASMLKEALKALADVISKAE